MPDHFHAILVPVDRNSVSDVTRFVKGGVSRSYSERFGVSGPVWQEGFHDRVVRNDADLGIFISYIEQNPVKAGFVSVPEDYSFSSAHKDCPTDLELYFGGSSVGSG
jgi:putative transposase